MNKNKEDCYISCMLVLKLLQEDIDNKLITEADQRKFSQVFIVIILSDVLSHNQSLSERRLCRK